MGKFWGSSPAGNESGTSSPRHIENGRSRESEEREQVRGEPDERTSLIPHNFPDHAVSPYNRFSVRSLRVLSIVLLLVAFIWWLALLVTTFVSPPGFYTRGGGWFAFAYSTFAVGILLVLLLFYSTPSKAERTILLGILGLLAVNTIIILASSSIRHKEAWAGVASVVWALLVTAWAVICDRVVESGKREEVRRIGLPENRFTFAEWCSIFAGTILLTVFLIISIFFTISLSIRARDGTLKPPGKLYYVDDFGFHVHLHCVGNKTNSQGKKVTTVFVEGGEDPVESRMESWVKEAYSQNAIKRYCYWDRPGFAWSDNGPSPLSAGRVADALSAALVKADETGPWVLVSHGVGGIYSRVFASRHSTDVQGLLLVDSLPESLLHRVGSPGRAFLLWLRGVIYPIGLDRLVSTIFMGHYREDRIYGRDAYQNGGQIKAKLQESLVAKSFTMNEINAARLILPKKTPIVVVSSGKSVKKSKQWSDGQRDISRLSDKLVAWDVVNGAGHNVWEDQRGRETLKKRLGQLANN